MFTPSRDEARRFFIDAWAKRSEALPLTPLEHLAADIVTAHPEYHALLARGEDAIAGEWTPEQGKTNPFLHMSLHLAVEEQLSVDRPPGIRAALTALEKRHGDRHAAVHEIIECLAETLWHAGRSEQSPDAAAYLECVRRRA